MRTRKGDVLWSAGSVFLVPLRDGTHCPGLVIAAEPSALNSVSIALFDQKDDWVGTTPTLNIDRIFSLLLVTRDLLDSGRWPIISRQAECDLLDRDPYERIRREGFIGAKVRGSANVEEFANAFYGLLPWDDWYLPNYLDEFLLTPEKKPIDRLVFSGRHGNLPVKG
jgi:hypothetical protein